MVIGFSCGSQKTTKYNGWFTESYGVISYDIPTEYIESLKHLEKYNCDFILINGILYEKGQKHGVVGKDATCDPGTKTFSDTIPWVVYSGPSYSVYDDTVSPTRPLIIGKDAITEDGVAHGKFKGTIKTPTIAKGSGTTTAQSTTFFINGGSAAPTKHDPAEYGFEIVDDRVLFFIDTTPLKTAVSVNQYFETNTYLKELTTPKDVKYDTTFHTDTTIGYLLTFVELDRYELKKIIKVSSRLLISGTQGNYSFSTMSFKSESEKYFIPPAPECHQKMIEYKLKANEFFIMEEPWCWTMIIGKL